MFASRMGHVEVVKALLSASANVNAQDENGWTALMSASLKGHVEVVKALLSAGADVNHQDKKGWTALCYAKKFEIQNLLKETGGVCPSS